MAVDCGLSELGSNLSAQTLNKTLFKALDYCVLLLCTRLLCTSYLFILALPCGVCVCVCVPVCACGHVSSNWWPLTCVCVCVCVPVVFQLVASCVCTCVCVCLWTCVLIG